MKDIHKKIIVISIFFVCILMLSGCKEKIDVEKHIREAEEKYEHHRPYTDNASQFKDVITSYMSNITLHLACVDHLLNNGNYPVAFIELQLADSNYSQMNDTLTEFNRWYMDLLNRSYDLELDASVINYHIFTKLHDSRTIRKDMEHQLSYKHKAYDQLVGYEA